MDLIKELINQINLRLRLDSAYCAKLEELEARCYRLEEDNKLLKAHNKIQDEQIQKWLLVAQSEGKKAPAHTAASAATPKASGY